MGVPASALLQPVVTVDAVVVKGSAAVDETAVARGGMARIDGGENRTEGDRQRKI